MKLYLLLSFLLLCFISEAQLPTMTGYLLNTTSTGSGGGTGVDVDSTWHTNGYSFVNTNNLDSTIIRKGAVAIQLDTILGLGNKLDTGLLIKGKYGTGIGMYNRYVSNMSPNQEIYFGNIFNPYNDTSTAYIRHSQTGNIFEFGQRTPTFVQRYMRLSPGAGVQFQIPNSEKFEITHGSIQKMWFDSTITKNYDDIKLIEGTAHIDTFFTMACVNDNEGKLAYLAIDTIRAYLGISTPSGSNPVLTTQSVRGSGIVGDSIRLMGDLTIPGNNKYYGTDNAGVRGFYPLNNVYFNTDFYLDEDFPNYNVQFPIAGLTFPTVGTHNWLITNTSNMDYEYVYEANHPGIIKASGNFIGEAFTISLSGTYFDLNLPNSRYEYIVKPESFSTNDSLLIGFSTPSGSEYLYIVFKGTNIYSATRTVASGFQYSTLSAYTSGNWYNIRLLVSGANINVYLNGASIGVISNVPNDPEQVRPLLRYQCNHNGADSSIYLDRVSFYQTVTR